MAGPTVRATARSLRMLSDLHRRCISLPPTICQQRAARHTESRILSQSTLLIQDGLEIRELPVIVRKTDPSSMFPFSGYSAQEIKHITKEDVSFRDHLQHCKNVQEVFQLLEVPADKVTSYSASFALQRICQLREHSDNDIDSFIRTAILNELYDTVTSDVQSLKGETVISVVKCYLRAPSHVELFTERINDELERRIGEGVFTIEELCQLIQLISDPKGCNDILNSLWIHLANRYKDITDENIAFVYQTLRYMSPEHKYILSLLEKQVLKFWWQLTSSDIASILKSLTLLNKQSSKVLGVFGKWLFLNIHNVSEEQLVDILAAYTQFGFSDVHFMKSLERYICVKKTHSNKAVVGMVMEYCRSRRVLSTRIFDSVAQDFEKSGHMYSPIHLLYTLRPFGQLNYLPQNTVNFFTKIEQVIADKFQDFTVPNMLELLASFVYIERFPINFIPRVFSPHFISKLQAIQDQVIKNKAQKHLWEFQAAMLVDLPKYGRPFIHKQFNLPYCFANLSGRCYKCHRDLGNALKSVLGADSFREAEIPRNTPHLINYEICLTEEGKVLSQKKLDEGNVSTRLALLIIMPENYCINSLQLLGEYAMRRRHLERLGYTVIQVDYDRFMSASSTGNKEDLVRDILEFHVDLSATEPQP